MTHRPPAALPVLSCALAGLLAGCAGNTGFPSLAPRPIEAIARLPEREAVPAARAVDPALETRVTAAESELGAAATDWAAAEAAARTATARAGRAAAGSEGWIAAQVAISRLSAIRERTAAATQTLDALRVAQAESARPADTARLDAAWARAVAAGQAQDAAFARAVAALPGG